jgi:hypothetical protein
LLSNAAGRSFTDAIAFPPDQHDTYFLVFVTRLITSHSPPNAREMPLLSLSFDILVAIFQELDTRDIVRVAMVSSVGNLNVTSDLITTLLLCDKDVHRPS